MKNDDKVTIDLIQAIIAGFYFLNTVRIKL